MPLLITRLTCGLEGSITALQPYARERYIQNHAMLSAVDKLHKLYASELAPVVWARSVGVEVLNELDTLKAAVMLSAGSSAPHGAGAPGWNMAAAGIESISGGVQVARAIGTGLQSVAVGVLRTAADTLARRM
jgi:ubiquinone biosynthesis monooxygenase Coq6